MVYAPDFLTTRQVADLLGKPVRHVHTLVARGDLTPVMRLEPPRGALFFDPTDVDRLVAELEQAS